MNLIDLKVGHEISLRAIDNLSNYVHSPQADDGCLAHAVAVLVDTICETNRFKPIYETIKAHGETGMFLDRLDIQGSRQVDWLHLAAGQNCNIWAWSVHRF
jgi:hypothetical protein